MFERIVACGREKGWKQIELRGAEPFLKENPHSSFFYGHSLELTENPDARFSALRDSTRRNIKKAQKENVAVAIRRDMGAMRAFYDLNCLTRRQHCLPPQPFSFFKKVHEHVISRNRGVIVLATQGGKPVAANVFFHFGRQAIYKYGASDKTYQHLRASNLVMWEALRWYCQNGFTRFSFGRTEPENDGLRQFKNGWGAKEYAIRYYKYDLQQNKFLGEATGVVRRYQRIFAGMPIFALKLAGRLVYRHMG
jgi:lipid II:glycine glycyltransferase (peptidoglycan interpeptide bridge formation enzyme)